MGKIGKVLLVDDDEITCYLNRNLIEKMVVAEMVESVNDGMQALQYIRGKYIGATNQANKKDLLLLDLNMPVMDGFEFLGELKKSDIYDKDRLVIVLLTSSQHKQDAENVALYSDIVHSYLIKPLQEENVKELVNSLKC